MNESWWHAIGPSADCRGKLSTLSTGPECPTWRGQAPPLFAADVQFFVVVVVVVVVVVGESLGRRIAPRPIG